MALWLPGGQLTLLLLLLLLLWVQQTAVGSVEVRASKKSVSRDQCTNRPFTWWPPK